jgi:hypothetical protein
MAHADNGGQPYAFPGSEEKAISIFSASVFTYCDAKLISNFYSQGIWQSKIDIGQMVFYGDGPSVTDKLRTSRQSGNQCDWSDTGYSYNDAQPIAAAWGLRGVDEAKSKMSMLATAGRQHWVDAALGSCHTDKIGKDYSLPAGQC